MKESELKKIMTDIFNDYGIPMVPLRVSGRMKRTLGSVRHNGKGLVKELAFSRYHMKHSPDIEVIGTLKHEIAHIIDIHFRGTSSHDHEWRSIARDIGTPESHISPTVKTVDIQARWLVLCGACGKIVGKRERKTASMVWNYQSNCCRAALRFIENPKCKK